MLSKQEIAQQIQHTLAETNFTGLGKRIQGKVRDSYLQDGQRVLVATDRVSAFDRVLTTIPFKGDVLTEMAAFWFDKTKDIIPNHVISHPDPAVMVVEEVQIVPIEVIVRGYITGSAWRDYSAGKSVSGVDLPKGLKKNQKFSKPILTPSTKAEHGAHDEAISRDEILKRKLVPKDLFEEIERVALALFARGTEHAASRNMILVDTKYEFGVKNGRVILADEVHTPDSSRYWYAKSYQPAFDARKDPEHLDKEFLRSWLIEKGWMGDGPAPTLDDELKVQFAARYIESYEQITGRTFHATPGSVEARLRGNLKRAGLAAA